MMTFILSREKACLNGIFGQLKDSGGFFKCFTLEHAYAQGAAFVPKLAPGTYICTRHPPNDLPYETWLINDVPPFQGQPVSGILIHKGNTMADSKGCVLVGQDQSATWLLDSKIAFDAFMDLTKNETQITLVVSR